MDELREMLAFSGMGIILGFGLLFVVAGVGFVIEKVIEKWKSLR